MKYSDLKKELKNKKFKNFYIFVGEEKAIVKKYLKQLAAIAVGDYSTLKKKLQNNGLFDTASYYIESDKEISDKPLNEFLKEIGSKRVILVLPSVDKRKKFYKDAQKNHMYFFDKLDANHMTAYIHSQIEIEPLHAGQLAYLCNYDISKVDNEIDKLVHLGRPISTDLLHELIDSPLEDKIFDMLNSVCTREEEKAFKLLEDLYELKESPVKIVVLLYNQFRALFLVQSMKTLSHDEIAKKTGLTSWQVINVKKLIGRFSDNRLANHLRHIQEMEISFKTGKVSPKIGMDLLMVRLLK